MQFPFVIDNIPLLNFFSTNVLGQSDDFAIFEFRVMCNYGSQFACGLSKTNFAKWQVETHEIKARRDIKVKRICFSVYLFVVKSLKYQVTRSINTRVRGEYNFFCEQWYFIIGQHPYRYVKCQSSVRQHFDTIGVFSANIQRFDRWSSVMNELYVN